MRSSRRGVPYCCTKGAKRVVAVDVTGLPVAALVVPASTHENRASDLMLEHPTQQGVAGRLELVLVDRGVTAAAARDLSREHDLEAAGSGGTTSNRSSAHSVRLARRGRPRPPGCSRRLSKPFEDTTSRQRAGFGSPASRPHCVICLGNEHGGVQLPSWPDALVRTALIAGRSGRACGRPRCGRSGWRLSMETEFGERTRGPNLGLYGSTGSPCPVRSAGAAGGTVPSPACAAAGDVQA